MAVKINEMYIPKGHPNRSGEKLTEFKAIIIHYTANDSPTASDINNVKYMGRQYKIFGNQIYEANGEKLFRKGSAHTFVDEDSITRGIPYDEVSWNCGDRQLPYNNGYKGQTKLAKDIFNHKQNYETIGIELCNNGNWKITLDNSIDEVVMLMKKYNIPITRIYLHHDLTGKICAEPFVNDEKAWNDYKDLIKNKIIEQEVIKLMTDYDNHWAKDSINNVKKKKIMSGYSDTKFDPDKNITRAELAKTIDNLLKYLEK